MSEVPQLRPIIRSTGDASITKLQAPSAASPGTPLDAREPAWCPSGLLFLQITDRYVDRSTKVNLEISFRFDTSIAKPDDFSTQRNTPESAVGCQGHA
jgi:hypothetical protein